jgi:hypothetical protein
MNVFNVQNAAQKIIFETEMRPKFGERFCKNNPNLFLYLRWCEVKVVIDPNKPGTNFYAPRPFSFESLHLELFYTRLLFAVNLFYELPEARQAEFLEYIRNNQLLMDSLEEWEDWYYYQVHKLSVLYWNSKIIFLLQWFTQEQIIHAVTMGSYTYAELKKDCQQIMRLSKIQFA